MPEGVPAREKRMHPKNLLLNVIIVALAAVVIFLSYSFVSSTFISKPVDWKTKNDGRTEQGEIIQLNVLNGCGISGTAQRFTDYLRKRNFDVVQASNYKTFDVEHSLVIDRVGDLETAKKVAYALGVADAYVIQQINTDYYLHVSVVIGRDYATLKPYE